MSPAVNLALEEVPFAILEVVKARIQANRRRLGVGQGEQKPPPSLKPRPQLRKFGASSKNYRRPEPAATGGGSAYHSGLWYALDDPWQSGSRTIRLRLYSGDTADSQELTFSRVADGYSGSQSNFDTRDWSVNLVLLPINKTSLLVVVSFASVSSGTKFGRDSDNQIISPPVYVTVGNRSEASQYAYFVGQSVVKEVALPTGLRTSVAASFYLPSGSFSSLSSAQASYSLAYRDAYTYWFSRAKFMDIDAGDLNEYGQNNWNLYDCGGAGSYSLFNNFTAATTLANGLNVGSSYGWQQDIIYNFISNPALPKQTLAISQLDPTAATALQYRGPYPPELDGAFPTFPPTDGVEDPVWKKAGKNPSPATRPADPYSTNPLIPSLYPAFFWDWGKPSYCREQLLALGFTEANLQP